MKNKIMIGVVFTTVMIILVSFVSVVGYQSAQTNDNELLSPLFVVRVQSANDKSDKKVIFSSYLGKGKSGCILSSFNTGKSVQGTYAIYEQIKAFIKENSELFRNIIIILKNNPQYQMNILQGEIPKEIKNLFQSYQLDFLIFNTIKSASNLRTMDPGSCPTLQSSLYCKIISFLNLIFEVFGVIWLIIYNIINFIAPSVNILCQNPTLMCP